MASLLDTLGPMLEEDGWTLQRLPERNALGAMVQGRNGTWACLALSPEQTGRLIFYSTYTAAVPPARRLSVCELINRLNYGAALGNFEMDVEDGEVRFRTSIEARDSPASPQLLRPLVYENLATADRYLPAFEQVIEGSASPADAIAAAEANGA